MPRIPEPKTSSSSKQAGGKAKESMPRKGAMPPNGKAKAKTPDFKVGGSYRSGRTIQGATGTKKRVSRAGAAREGMGSATRGAYSRTDENGRSGFGRSSRIIPKKSAAGRGKGGEMMGSSKSSSAKAGIYAKAKAKVSRTRSMY